MERDLEIKAALAEETANLVDESVIGDEAVEQSDEVASNESKQETPEEAVPEDSPSS